MIIGKCYSPPRELAPYLNGKGKIVPVPKDSFGPLKTESPVSAKTVEMIRLYGRKEASNELPIPEVTDRQAKVPMAQAVLAVSPFRTRPNLYAQKESTSKKVQKIKMKRSYGNGKENRPQRSLVHVRGDVSDSDDDLPFAGSATTAKRSAAKSLTFGSKSPKGNTVVKTKERHDKLRSEYATHKMSSCIDV
jgi:hypothetical protein